MLQDDGPAHTGLGPFCMTSCKLGGREMQKKALQNQEACAKGFFSSFISS